MAKWPTFQTYFASLAGLSSFRPWVLLGRLYLFCSSEWHYLHPKTYPLWSSSGCHTIDYTILPLSFWHTARSAHPPHLICGWHCPSTSVLVPDTISHRLSNVVTTLLKYFTTWKLWLNTHKTETILFPNPPPQTLFKSRTPVCPGPRPSAI